MHCHRKDRTGLISFVVIGFKGDSQTYVFTLEHGEYLSPGRDSTLTGVLAQRGLQEEHRDTTEEEEYKVRDEEHACRREPEKNTRELPW